MRSLSLGFSDFRTVRNEGRYYVDKTSLIRKLVHNDALVYLFTRPRRFGKSLNLSMLDAFFNVEYKGNKWFDGLEVMEYEDCTEVMNTYPVVKFELKDLILKDRDSFISSFADNVRALFKSYRYLLGSDVDDVALRIFDRLRQGEGSEVDLQGSLKLLTELLEEYHGKKVIVLIDEYDNAINNSYGTDIQKDIIDFMRGLFHKSLKDNDSLRLGVITGIMQIAKENIFSGLNHVDVNNIFTDDFDECFGFTESEVKEMLTYYGHPEKMDEVREWYDGYRFGSSDIYNPWSVLKYVKGSNYSGLPSYPN